MDLKYSEEGQKFPDAKEYESGILLVKDSSGSVMAFKPNGVEWRADMSFEVDLCTGTTYYACAPDLEECDFLEDRIWMFIPD